MTRSAELAKVIGKGSVDIHGEAGTTSSGSTGKTTNLQQGLAKSWNTINGDDGVSNDSFNAASFTDVGTGMYKWAFSNNMETATYVSTAGYGHTETADHGVRWPHLNSHNITSETRGIVNNGNGDVGRVNVIIMGDLA